MNQALEKLPTAPKGTPERLDAVPWVGALCRFSGSVPFPLPVHLLTWGSNVPMEAKPCCVD